MSQATSVQKLRRTGRRHLRHPALIHSIDGEFTHDPKTGRTSRLKSGGHGQVSIDLMDDLGIEYHIVKTYQNGVRLGNVPDHKASGKQSGTGQAWFPKNWSTRDIVKAGEYVVSLKSNANVPDGVTMWGTYRGVRVGIKRTDGRVSTVFPSLDQPSGKKRGRK